MRKKWWIFLVAPPAMVLFVAIFGEIVMHLWNWLAPALFDGMRLLSGSLSDCCCCAGSCSADLAAMGATAANGRPSRWRWERMTPEEREKFQQRMRNVAAAGAPRRGNERAA